MPLGLMLGVGLRFLVSLVGRLGQSESAVF